MLFRKKQKDIIEWLCNEENGLLITGARQVGKTYLIRETLKKANIEFLEINLVENPTYASMFESTLKKDINTFIEQLSVIANKPLTKKETIIFIDEVQECKELVTAIKFLVEEGSYKYIFSGSLLGVELTNLRSAPVGYLRIIEMFPLDLEEFLIANGLHNTFINQLKKCFTEKIRVNELLHEKIMDAFYKYLIVGGMPRAVSTYLKTNDLISTSLVHKDIINLYIKDFTKYEENKSAKLKLIKTYNLIPAELNEQNKRFVFKHLDDNIKFDRYENSFDWLSAAGVALPIYNVVEPKIPLELNKKSNLFKMFLSDVGMLTTLFGRATILKLLQRDEDINYGAVFENFVAQELIAHGYKGYYYNSKKYGELDFVIEHLGEALPIEVKSGKNYKSHSALNNAINLPNYNINQSIVFSNYNVEVKNKIIYYPIYMIMFINEELLEIPKIPPIDFSDLKK